MARAACLFFASALALAAAGCGNEPSTQPAPAAAADSTPPPAEEPPADASVPTARDATAPAGQATFDQGTFHLDEPSLRYAPAEEPIAARRQLQITLRSTPPQARVLVDGKSVGRTPAYWEGQADGTPREFTFVLSGFAMARYRFVPTQSGIVHATLERLAGPVPADAGPTQ